MEDFRGDYESVSALLERSWAENPEPSLRYTPEYLRSSFEYPGCSPNQAPTIYEDDSPVAFVAGFPRTIQLQGQVLRLLVNTFLTADPRYKGKGYGAVVWTEFLKRAKAADYDGTINFCVDGGPTNGIVLECSRRLHYVTRNVFSVPYLARLLRPSAVPVVPVTDEDIEHFLSLSARLVDQIPLARIWTRAEAEWQCRRRTGALVASLSAGPRRGMITGTLVDVLANPPMLSLLVEDILWGGLEAEERLRLLQQFMAQGAAAGAQLASVPQMGYADMTPFATAGFRKSRRLVHTYLTLWNNSVPVEPLSSVYIDVF